MISAKFMEKLKARKNPVEIYYYIVRCEYNAMLCQQRGDQEGMKKFLSKAGELGLLLPKERSDQGA